MKNVTCKTLEGKSVEVGAGELVWRPSVYGVIVQDGKILMLPENGGHDFPGGGVDLGETIEQALVREVWEETGYKVEPVKLLHVADSFFHLDTGIEKIDGSFQSVLMFYTCKIVGGELSDENFDVYEKEHSSIAQWIPVEEFDQIKQTHSYDSKHLAYKVFEELDLR